MTLENTLPYMAQKNNVLFLKHPPGSKAQTCSKMNRTHNINRKHTHTHIWKHTQTHLEDFGDILTNIWTHTQKHVVKYIQTVGQIHKHI